MNSCEQEINTKDNYIIIKEKTGYFEVKKPAPIKGVGYTFITSKGDTIYLENPVDKELESEYLKAKDSLAKLELYLKAIQKRTYKDSLKDKNIKIEYIAETTGTLDNIKITYKTFADTVKIKQPIFSLLGGLSLQSNTITLKTYPGLNIGFQNKKKDIFLLGVNTNQDVEVKYVKNIFTFKK